MATISQQLIAGLQNPSMLAPLGRAAEAIGYYPTQLKKQGMLEQIQNAKTEEDRAKALIEYGKLTRNDNMVLKGTDLMRQAKQSGVANQVASLTNVLSNPILNKAQSDQLRSHIEQYASKAGLNLAPVISGMNAAATRQIANLDQEAVNAVNSGVSRQAFEKQYAGQGARWDAAKVNKSRQDDALDAIANKPRIAEINRINAQMAQESLKPAEKQDPAKLQALENILVSLRQQIGDSKAYESVGSAQASITGAQDRAFKAAQAAAQREKFEQDAKVNLYADRAMASSSPILFLEEDESLKRESNAVQEKVALAVNDRQEKLKGTDSQSPRKLNSGEEEAWKKSKDLLLQNPMIKAAWTTYTSEQASLERKIDAVKVLRSAIKAENERLQSRETKKEVAELNADTAIRFFLQDDAAQISTLPTMLGFGADVYDVVEDLYTNESKKNEFAAFKKRLTEEYIRNPEASPGVVIPEIIAEMQFDIPGERETRKRQQYLNDYVVREKAAIDARVEENLLQQNPNATQEELNAALESEYFRYIARVQVEADKRAIQAQSSSDLTGFARHK